VSRNGPPVAVVSGASRGLGRATAVSLAEAGFVVAALARSPSGLEQTCTLLRAAGPTPLPLLADVTDADAVREAVATVEAKAGPVAVLVNNAGSLQAIGPLWEVQTEDWWADVNTSLGGAFNCCREVVPGMIARRSGRVVNLLSNAAVRAAPYETGYAAAKAGLASLTEGLASSLAEHGVFVFGVAAAYTETPLTRELRASEAGRRWLPGLAARRGVEATRTARLIVRLALGEADELTGRFLHTMDDLDELLPAIEVIRGEELYLPRVRRLHESDERARASDPTD
jgi:NAD(P)-dependent dehydrogenase (short-subunit alcohol dehydrogenase family)